MSSDDQVVDQLANPAVPPVSGPWGVDGEEAARRFAGGLGLPDFVYDPVVLTGDEGGDAILCVGDRGLFLRSTPRKRAGEESPEKATAWIRREVRKAAKQVAGTRRQLEITGPKRFTSKRGYERLITNAAGWPGVVIVHHPSIPDGLVVDVPSDMLVMSLDDWYGLNTIVRSTAGVIEYIRRALKSDVSVPLGQEARRYAALADVDSGSSGEPSRVQIVPRQPVTGPDARYLDLVEEWIDADSAAGAIGLPWRNPDHYRLAVEQIDRLPALLRVDLGHALERVAEASAAHAGGHSTNCFAPGVGQFIVYADTFERWASGDHVQAYLGALAAVRHEQFTACLPSPRSTVLLGHLTRVDGPAVRTFVFVDGSVTRLVLPELRWQIVKTHGIFGLHGPVPVQSLGRNDKCPCLSGKKFKACHLAAL